MQFWILDVWDVWDASDGRTQSAWESVSLLSAKSANKFQQISSKSFASRRSLTAKSANKFQQISRKSFARRANKKKHARTHITSHTHASTHGIMKRKNIIFPTPAEHVIQLQEEVAKLENELHQKQMTESNGVRLMILSLR
jgi:aspartate carbamoyltransferase catalytic subunit